MLEIVMMYIVIFFLEVIISFITTANYYKWSSLTLKNIKNRE